jgi:hypothetical protein
LAKAAGSFLVVDEELNVIARKLLIVDGVPAYLAEHVEAPAVQYGVACFWMVYLER